MRGIRARRMRSLWIRIIALFTVLSVLVPSDTFARTQYFCHMMGRVMPTCCCEPDEQPSNASCEAQIRSASCCERMTSARHATMPSIRENASTIAGAAWVAVVEEPACIAATAPRIANTAPPPRTRAPPAVGPPLFVAHCAFLI